MSEDLKRKQALEAYRRQAEEEKPTPKTPTAPPPPEESPTVDLESVRKLLEKELKRRGE